MTTERGFAGATWSPAFSLPHGQVQALKVKGPAQGHTASWGLSQVGGGMGVFQVHLAGSLSTGL